MNDFNRNELMDFDQEILIEIAQAQTPVQIGLPQLEIVPSECDCCWEWIFKRADASDLNILAWLCADDLDDLWQLLFLMIDPDATPGITYAIDLDGDQSKASAVFKFLSAQEIQLGVKYQDEGLPCHYLSFCCTREAWIDFLSHQIQQFVTHANYPPNIGEIEQMQSRAIYATAPEWPWSLFPLWRTLNNTLEIWQIKWLIFISLENTLQYSQLKTRTPDPIDALLNQCYWNLFLTSCLPDVPASKVEYHEQFAQYNKECTSIFDFAIEMAFNWRDGHVYGADSQINRYYDKHRSYLEQTQQNHLTRLRWWISHLKYMARRAHPELYDWGKMQPWEFALEQTQPAIFERLKLKWRQNTIWQACFEKEVEHA